MKLQSEKRKGRIQAGDVLQPEQVWDVVSELRKSVEVMREYIKHKAEAGLFTTALNSLYYLRSFDQGVLPLAIGARALVDLRQRVVELERSYQGADSQYTDLRLNQAVDQIVDALTISAQFPELQANVNEVVTPIADKVVAILEHATDSGGRSVIKFIPLAVFSLQFVDSKSRGKGLVKILETEIVDEWVAQTKRISFDQDTLVQCLMNGIYLRILYPHRESELVERMEQLPSLKEEVLKETQPHERFFGTLLAALAEAHQVTADEHGQIHAQLREPVTPLSPGLPQRPSL